MDFYGERSSFGGTVVAAFDAVAERAAGRSIGTWDALLGMAEALRGADGWPLSLVPTAGVELVPVDPEPYSGDVWRGTPLTGTCAGALRRALEQGRTEGRIPLPVGLVARSLVADPASAAARRLGATGDEPPLEGRVMPGTQLAAVPPRRRWAPWLTRRGLWVVAVMTAVVVAVAASWQLTGWNSVQTVHLKGGATVTARLRSGHLAATTLRETPNLALADPLASPIRVTADPRELEAPATISFPVTVAAGLDPGQDVGIAMRSPSTGGRWIFVGGTYDPATHRVSVLTRHFSDWLPIVHDIKKLAGKAAAFLTGLLHGNPPGTDCQGQPRGLSISDSVQPPLAACLSATGEMQIVNPHGFPLDLTLPAGVTATSNNTRQTLGESLWIPAFEGAGTGSVLLGESKRIYRLDTAHFNTGKPAVTASVDVPTFVFDMAEFLAGLLLPRSLDDEKETESLAQPTQELMGCVRSSASALKNQPDIGSFLTALGKLVKTCYLPAAKDLLAATAKKFSVDFGKDALSFLFRPLDLIFHYNDYRHTATEVLSTSRILASGPYKPAVLIYPGLDPTKASKVTKAAASGNCSTPFPLNLIPGFGALCEVTKSLLNLLN